MTRHIWLVMLLALLLGLLADAVRADFRHPSEPYLLVAPTQVAVKSGGAIEKIFTFTLSPNVLGPVTIAVENGAGKNSLIAAAGEIWLDNIQIAGPNDFRPDVASFSRDVDAGLGSHTLRVVLSGQTNSGIKVAVSGRSLLTVPVSAAPAHMQIGVGASPSLAITLFPVPAQAGNLLLSVAQGFASVPAQVAFGAGQAQVQVPISGQSVGLDTLRASLNGRTIEVPLNVIPASAKLESLSPPLARVGLDPVVNATMTVTLKSALPSDVHVSLTSSPAGLVSHPSTVLVPANTRQAQFAVQAVGPYSGPSQALLTASLNGSETSSQVNVLLNQHSTIASLLPATSQISQGTKENLTLLFDAELAATSYYTLSSQPPGIVTIPSQVGVPAGTNQVQIPVTGLAAGSATVRVDDGYGYYFGEAVVQVTPPPVEISGLEPPTADVLVGAASEVTVKLNTAQLEAVEVGLAASPGGVVSVPAAVSVPAGASKATFRARAVGLGQAQILGSLNGKTKAAVLNVVQRPLELVSLLPAGLRLAGAGSLTLTVDSAQPQDTSIPLSVTPAGVVQVPATVLLPAGQTSVTVPVSPVDFPATATPADISATYNGTSVAARVWSVPEVPAFVGVVPYSITTPKGRPVTLTVKLDGTYQKAGPVTFTSSAPSVASVPARLLVPAGTNELVLAVNALEEGVAEITAASELFGGSALATVTVTPAEVVAIAISPIEHTAYPSDRVQYTAHGILTDASQRDVTGEVQWLSSDENVAAMGVTGVADTFAAGSVQIVAAKDGASQQTGLTVLAGDVLSLSATQSTLKEGESASVTVTSSVPAGTQGLEISFSGGGTGSLQLPLSVTIPAGQTSATFTVTGQTIGQYQLIVSAPRHTRASLDFTIVSASDLSITGLNPASGEAGSLVEILGMGFDADPAKNTVIFFGNATAAVVDASATSLMVKVPPLAQTGAITVTTPKGTVQSPVFSVIRQQDFALTASPASQILLTGGQAVYSLALSSLGVQSFTGLASLKVTGLPTGVTAKFSPLNLALNQAGSLVLSASSAAQTGSATITVEATALVAGVPQTRTAQVTLDVQSAVGVTGVKGRFVTPEGQGIAGVRVNVDANQTVSDSAGNFLLTGLPAGKITLRMDATPAHPLYPIWPAIIELESGKLTVLPNWPIVTPPADDKFTAISNATQDQIITDARYPGVGITMPAGVTITGWDGVPKTRMAIERVHPEHLGVPSPPVPTKEHYQLYFGTPMGGIPDQPIPVTLPNVAELEPGAKGEIWYFDGSPMNGVGEWKLAGTATVSEDGATLTTDPGQGVPRFCGKCGLFAEACPPIPQGPPAPEPCPDGNCCDNKSQEPIEYYSGHEKPSIGGLACGGRTPIAAGLSYSPVDAFQLRSGLEGAVGQGWVLDYDIVLAHRSSKSKRILLPPNVRIDFTQQADGSYATSSPAYSGAVLHLANGTTDVWELTHKDGRIWRFGQSDLGNLAASFLTAIVDPQGNATQITRRADHKITAIGTNERAHTYSYGADNLVDKITDPAGREMRFTYNAARRIETVTDADGGVTRYTYVDDSEYPASPVCTQGTDGLRIKTIQYPGVSTLTENFHGSSRRVLRQTSRLGETRFAYQLTGACITHVSDPSKVCTANCPHEDSWEAWQDGWRFYGGQVVATRVTEPSGRETLRRFDARGILLEKTDPDGAQTRKVLDAQNRVVQKTDVLGRVTRYAYDADGNVISQQDPLGRITDTQYDPKWNAPTLITRYLDDGSPVVTQVQYHATFGQPTKLTDPENRATTLAYTTKGQLASLTDPLGQQTLLAYNPAGDLVEVEDPLGNLTRLATDGAGRTVSSTTPKGYDWQQSRNGKSQPRVETDPTGGKIESVYDEAGRIVSIWDQNGNPVERYTYDERGNVVARTDALNQSDTYQYDAANRLIAATTRKGEVVTFAYDGQDRLTQVSRPDSTTSYSYDAAGRLIQVQEGATRLQYEYDQADRLVREVQDTPSGYHSVEYQYDALDRRVSRKVNGGDETRYSWNKANQLTQIQFRGETTTYQYDAAGRLAQKTLPGGIVQAYQYDAASRLTQIQYKNGATLIDQLDLAYDAEGNIVSKKLANGSLNQDTALTASFDAANRMTGITVNGKTYALGYDANGNLIGKTNTADAGDSTVYTWNTRNRLTGITAPGLTASFQYDPLGRRVGRIVNGEATSYLYDGVQAIGEVRGGQTTALLTGLAIDEAIAGYASSGRLTQLTDQLGSVIRQIDEAGATQSQTAYSPYGEATTSGDDRGNSTEYTARENDGTGLYFYRARYFEPVLKRFISEDPIGTQGGINLAGYVLGNPVKHTDPTGEIVPALVVGAIAFYTGYQAGQAGMGLLGDFLGLGEAGSSAYENVVNCGKTGQGCGKAQEDVKKLVPKTMCAVKSGADAIGSMPTRVSTYDPNGVVLDGIKNAAGGMSKLP